MNDNGLIQELISISEAKKIFFDTNVYISEDSKTVMGEVPFKEILFLDYRDTEAGSNPREYIGLKKTNEVILKSLLAHKEMFRFLHSGIIISLTDTSFLEENKSISFNECCLTNGNQTRFIILILAILKLFSLTKELENFNKKDFDDFIKMNFGTYPRIDFFLKRVKFNKVTEIVNFLKSNSKYMTKFNAIEADDFFNTKIRMQINLIDPILSDLDEKIDEYTIGSMIAEANNDTQNVKIDDIFGNKYKNELSEYIFKNFIKSYQDKIRIEFRMGEIAEKIEKVHILTLLRPIVATGILTLEKDIFRYSNQREPVYKLYGKLLRERNKEQALRAINSISKLIPFIFELKTRYIEPILDLQKKIFVRDYTERAVKGELESTTIGKKIVETGKSPEKIRKIIIQNVSYNFEHLFPVLIYRIRKLFQSEHDGKISLVVGEEDLEKFFKALIESVYRKYIDLKLKGLPTTSLTTVVRSKDFYDAGEETYTAFKHSLGFTETKYIEDNRYVVK